NSRGNQFVTWDQGCMSVRDRFVCGGRAKPLRWPFLREITERHGNKGEWRAMPAPSFDFAPGLPPPAVRWNGRVKFDFTGGNNDPDRVPVDGLIAAAESVLKREGRMLAIYGVNQGPQGYRPL